MSSSRKEGSIFEDAFESSCKKLKIFFSRNRDVYIPPKYRKEIRVPKNLYDYFMFSDKKLFPLELKSTKDTSLSFKNIKDHQLKALEEADKFENVIAGLLINFRREDGNKAFFIHIRDFLKYKKVANGEEVNKYICKVNKSSISHLMCEEIGIEIKNYKLKVNHHYHVREFIEQALEKYSDSTTIFPNNLSQREGGR